MQVKHIAHVQWFLLFGFPTQSKAGLRPGTASTRVCCIEVHTHFDTPTKGPPITLRVILVTMIFNTSVSVHLTCVFMYIQSDYPIDSTSTCVCWT